MSEVLNEYQQQGYETGINYIDGLLRIAERQFGGDIQQAFNLAMSDLAETSSDELVLGTREAFRWLQDHPTELKG